MTAEKNGVVTRGRKARKRWMRSYRREQAPSVTAQSFVVSRDNGEA